MVGVGRGEEISRERGKTLRSLNWRKREHEKIQSQDSKTKNKFTHEVQAEEQLPKFEMGKWGQGHDTSLLTLKMFQNLGLFGLKKKNQNIEKDNSFFHYNPRSLPFSLHPPIATLLLPDGKLDRLRESL